MATVRPFDLGTDGVDIISRGCCGMVRYEVYLLDQEGRVCQAKWVTQINDQHALTAAAAMVEDGGACQVWEYGRLVGEFYAAECEAADARESLRLASHG
jgi:hypothetical protein